MSVPIPWRAQPLIPAKKNRTDHNLDPSPSPKRRHSPYAAQPNPNVIPKWPSYSAGQAHPASPSRKSKKYCNGEVTHPGAIVFLPAPRPPVFGHGPGNAGAAYSNGLPRFNPSYQVHRYSESNLQRSSLSILEN